MVHPLVFCGVLVGTVLVGYGGYKLGTILYEWHTSKKEQREYEEFVRAHYAEKGRYTEAEEDEDDDNEPLGTWKQKRDSLNSDNNHELRHRNISSLHNSEVLQNSYEFYEMERSISERKSFLEREKEILEKEQVELERRRSLLQSKGNNITGVFSDDSGAEQDPFGDLSFIEQQQKSNTKHMLTQTEDSLDGSWSDLCDFEEISNNNNRSDSNESFEKIIK